jgi:hypothetical protein
MDYNGLVYMLTCDDPSLVYIGSSVQTKEKRLKGHQRDYKKWKNGSKEYCSSFKLFDVGNVKIEILIDNLPPIKSELYKIEALIIKSEHCVNMSIPCNSLEVKEMATFLSKKRFS